MTDFTAFWSSPCPERGNGAGHLRWGHCPNIHQPPHAYDQCCICERRASQSMTYRENGAPEPIVEPDPIEPAYTSPKRGAGALSDKDKARLAFYVNHLRSDALTNP